MSNELLKHFEILAKHRGAVSIAELSDMTKFRTDDIVKTLQAFNLLRYYSGQHSIIISPKTLEQYFTKAKPNWVIIPENIPDWWQPYSKRLPSASGKKP